MTPAARAAQARTVDPLDVLIARARARATLYEAGEIADLQEAVDALQAAAERDGLVDRIGQDAVQAIIADAFGPVQDAPELDKPDPSAGFDPITQAVWNEAERKADAARAKPNAPEREAAESTVETLAYALRSRGVAALDEARIRERLQDLSASQLQAVIARMDKARGQYPAIADALLQVLRELVP